MRRLHRFQRVRRLRRGDGDPLRRSLRSTDCRDVLLPLVTDQLSGQLDDRSIKPDHEACVQLLSTVLDILDRRDVVRGSRSWRFREGSAASEVNLSCPSFRVPPESTCS